MENVYGGFVRLVDTMGDDTSIVEAARVSYGGGTKTVRGAEGLIRYLMRHWHTTPFEMVEFKFHIKMPMFVARQHFRHRTASVNEMSARYSVIPQEFFVPEGYRKQAVQNKQSSEDTPVPKDPVLRYQTTDHCTKAFELYEEILNDGGCRELARCHLPQSTYTEFYWKIDLHNLLHYLQLRMDPGAQKEIRSYAEAIYRLVQPKVPITMLAFRDFRLESVTLSAVDIECLQSNSLPPAGGEREEFLVKMRRLGINII